MKSDYKILVLNLGSTSTKVAVFQNESKLSEENLEISAQELKKYRSVFDQYDIRRKAIEDYIINQKMTITDFDIIVSRGCGGGNQISGAYCIDEAYVQQCHDYETPHPTSVGPCIAFDLAKEYGIEAYVYDAEGINEFSDFSFLSGNKDYKIIHACHILNSKAICRKEAAKMGGKYEDFNFVVCHMGGGVSVSIHERGRLVDVSADAYAPERSGGISLLAIIDYLRLCFSGEYTFEQMLKKHFSQGGLVSYLGTSDLIEVERRISEGDKKAEFYYDGMIYQLAQSIGAMCTVVDGNVDCIIMTGGMANSEKLITKLTKKVSSLARIEVYPGSFEMDSLAAGALRAARGEEPTHYFVSPHAQ